MIVLDHFQAQLNGIFQIDRSFHRCCRRLRFDERVYPGLSFAQIDIFQLPIEIVKVLDQDAIIVGHFDLELGRFRLGAEIDGDVQFAG